MIYFASMKHTVKVLIIRFSSIGDIVLTTPVIRCLKTQLEGDVEIHYLTKKAYQDLLNHNSYLSKIHCIEKSTNEVIEDLKAENFDYVIDLHKNLRSGRVKRKLNALSFSFDKLNVQKWLLVNLKINRMPNVHIVDRYLAAAKALGIENDGKGLDYFLPEHQNEDALLPKEIGKNYVALVLGANHATKKLPLNKLKSLLGEIQQNVVLIGGKEDANWGEDLASLDSKRIFNACGKMNLNQSAALIKNAQWVITPDTGMMHIAAAFQKKIISIWGNTVPEFGMYPYLKEGNKVNSIVVQNTELNCRPCSKIGFDKCPKGHFKCMENLQNEDVIQHL